MFTRHISLQNFVIFLPQLVVQAAVHKYAYWRTLPHIQKTNRPLFVTFSTYKRWLLPPLARQAVLDCCVGEHGRTISLYVAVIMPDHVHLIFTPSIDGEGWPCSLPDIMRRIKSRSAVEVNRLLCRQGRVWQDESFDHVLRSNESLAEKVDYVGQNPVRAGIASPNKPYTWLWRGPIPVI
jgi:REP element-mobilizing transposase RayT